MKLNRGCRLCPRDSSDFTNVMTAGQSFKCGADLSLIEEEPTTRSADHSQPQLSMRGSCALDQLLLLLPTHLESKSMSHVSPLPPVFIFSVCAALRRDYASSSAEEDDDEPKASTHILPSVLTKLRTWRLLDSNYRCSPQGMRELALDLAGIAEDALTPTIPGSDRGCTSRSGRLRMKWFGSESSFDNGRNRDQETSFLSTFPSLSPLPLPSPILSPSPLTPRHDVFHSALDYRGHLHCDAKRASKCHLSGHSHHRKRIGTSDSEGAILPSILTSLRGRRHSASEFRSGCVTCRHPRVSDPPAPPSPPPRVSFSLPQRTQSDSINQLDSIVFPRHQKGNVIHHSSADRKTKREQRSHRRSVSADESTFNARDPLFLRFNISTAPGIPSRPSKLSPSLPRSRTVSSDAADVLAIGSRRKGEHQQCVIGKKAMEPSEPGKASMLPDHTLRQDNGCMPAHGRRHRRYGIVASADLRLPLGKSSTGTGAGNASRTDPRNAHVGFPPIRAQSFSVSVSAGHSLPIGRGNTVKASGTARKVLQLSSNTSVGFGFGTGFRARSGSRQGSKSLPLPSRTGSRHPTRKTTTSSQATTPPPLIPTRSLTPSRVPAKARIENVLGLMTTFHSPRLPRSRLSTSLTSSAKTVTPMMSPRGILNNLGFGRHPLPLSNTFDDPTHRVASSPMNRQTGSIDLTIKGRP